MTVTAVSEDSIQTSQSANNVLFAKFTLNAARDRVFWKGLDILRTGSGQDSDVNSITVWKDSNGDGVFEPGTDAMISSGNDNIFAGEVIVNFATQTVDTNGGIYFLTANVSPTAPIGNQVGFFRSSATTDFFLISPDVTSSAGIPFDTVITTITPQFNTLTVTTGVYTTPASLEQGTTVAMQLLTFTVEFRQHRFGTLYLSGRSAPRCRATSTRS